MFKLFAYVTSGIAAIAALASSGACWAVWLDEPEMPKSLLK